MSDARCAQPPDLTRRVALRPREAAAALGISERTLRKWMRDEELPFLRVEGSVLIPVEGLREWMGQRLEAHRRCDEIAEEVLRDL